jgi:hypothetical protein
MAENKQGGQIPGLEKSPRLLFQMKPRPSQRKEGKSCAKPSERRYAHGCAQLCAKRIPLPMKKSLRLLVLAGTLALLASPVFAVNVTDGPGNGTNPPPTSAATITMIVTTILGALGY